MKIIHLTTFLDFGGIERKKENISSWKDDNDWVFVAINKGGVAEEKIKANDKKVICLNLPYRIPSFTTILKLARLFRELKPDVIHAAGAEASFFGFFAGKLAKVPKIIVEEIGIPNHSRLAKSIFGFLYKKSYRTLVESKSVADFLIGNYNLSPDIVTVVPNFGTFDYDLSKLKRVESNYFNILMVSRLEPVKNIEGVINVISRFVKLGINNIKLNILGSGTLETSLKEKVEQLQIADYVNFVGFVKDPFPYLINTDLYILNSFTEGFSNSLLEAMYSKTPSLSTTVGAAEDLINDGENGFLVPADNEDALFNKLKEITDLDPETLMKIGVNGYQSIIGQYTLKSHISQLLEIYDGKS
ncbi:glycosyltransferase [Epilithonimonas sp. JDS]|uniref:glycosyltransferase n=1 Tax=Epilithonimonas sp. JDS TaxID=2902797 RepID=UPI001E38C9CD|nr:glycosyltransferase [Epilithonimonas sp. JDS]MCD9853813.1 glycosyltransferase [Epilithonimonas sp. JDS]